MYRTCSGGLGSRRRRRRWAYRHCNSSRLLTKANPFRSPSTRVQPTRRGIFTGLRSNLDRICFYSHRSFSPEFLVLFRSFANGSFNLCWLNPIVVFCSAAKAPRTASTTARWSLQGSSARRPRYILLSVVIRCRISSQTFDVSNGMICRK